MTNYRSAEREVGYMQGYRYNRGYEYHYNNGIYSHTLYRNLADTYQQAPLGVTTQVYDSYGSGFSGGGSGGASFPQGISGGIGLRELPSTAAAEAVTPFTRFESEGPCEDCYGLLADILHAARPFPKLIPGVSYGPSEGHSADIVLWLTNIFGQRVPVNVGFADSMIEFGRAFLGLNGMKRPDQVFAPKYGIVTYQDKEALQTLSGIKDLAKRSGMQVNAKAVNVHRTEDELREQIDGMSLLPQDVTAAILYGLVSYGREIPKQLLQRAEEIGVMSVNAAANGMVILPTRDFVFRIETGDENLDAEDAALVKNIFLHLENAKEVFGRNARRGNKNLAREVAIGKDAQNYLVVVNDGVSYRVTKEQDSYRLQTDSK